MNRNEVTELLAAAAAVDQYAPQPDELVLRVWTNMLADVPVEAGHRALVEHYRHTSTTITPADVAERWRVERQHPRPRRARPAFDAERIHAGVEACVAELVARKAIDAGEDRATAVEVAQGEAAARRRVRAVACPHCQASPGNGCVVVGVAPERPMSGHHPSRADAAFAAANPISDPS